MRTRYEQHLLELRQGLTEELKKLKKSKCVSLSKYSEVHQRLLEIKRKLILYRQEMLIKSKG